MRRVRAPEGPAARASTAEQAAERLSGLILDGTLPPGRPVRESVLAVDLGVSRNTIREAVRILERSGLVRLELNRGAVVREPSAARIEDLYRARLAIEVGAVHAAPADADPGPLERAVEAFDAALRTGERGPLLDADVAFHAAVVGRAGSPRLSDLFRDVAVELRLYLALLASRGPETEAPAQVVADHARLAGVVLGPDRAAAASAVGEHVRVNGARVAAIVRDR
jgi:DNA-binding GntR family transcriptional regulator